MEARVTEDLEEPYDAAEQAERRGDWHEVVVHIQQATKIQPLDATLWTELGDAQTEVLDYEAALVYFERALQ